MIRRIYIDNYRCLVNFECTFENINLILGVNGGGKSTVFRVLTDIADFVTGRSPVGLFRDVTLTRWQTSNLQTFELEVEGNGGVYQYRLEVEHQVAEHKQRVKVERVRFDGKPLYCAELGDVQLYGDDHTAGPAFSGDWTQSGLPFLGERRDNTKVTWLKTWFREKLLSLQIDPFQMKATASASESQLDTNAANFVGWYARRISTDMSATISLYDALKEMYDDFGGLKLEPAGGDMNRLVVTYGVREEEGRRPVNEQCDFNDLSDGERSLIVLYTLTQVLSEPHLTLCIDEPDNFLALTELEPWLVRLTETVESYSSQALLISHHPELINYLAPRCGLIYERENNGPTRVRRFEAGADEGCLTPAEVVARGWE